jgi:hypothetical protein
LPQRRRSTSASSSRSFLRFPPPLLNLRCLLLISCLLSPKSVSARVLILLAETISARTRYLYISLLNFRGHCFRHVTVLRAFWAGIDTVATNMLIYCPLLQVLLLLCTAVTVMLVECGESTYMVLLAFNVQVTHLMGVLGFGTFCYLLGASKLSPNPSLCLCAYYI